MSNHSKGLLMISITAALWGILAIVLKYALQRFSGNTIIWFRFTFSFVFLSGYYIIHRPRFFEILIKPPILGIIAGLAMAGNYLGFTSGVALTSPSNAQILIQISPLLVAIVGVVYFKEHLTLLQKSGFGIAAAGFVFFLLGSASSLDDFFPTIHSRQHLDYLCSHHLGMFCSMPETPGPNLGTTTDQFADLPGCRTGLFPPGRIS